MLKQATYVAIFGIVVAVGGVYALQHRIAIGPVMLALALVPLVGLLLAKRSFKHAIPDLVFGGIDTGLLVIPALWGNILFGVAGGGGVDARAPIPVT